MISTKSAHWILLLKIPADNISIALDLRKLVIKKSKYSRGYMKFVFSFNTNEEVPEVPPV